jgi:Ca2+-transporting ATPase
MRTLAEVVRETGVDPAKGLDEATVARSRQRFGANALTPLAREPIWRKFLAKFDDPIIRILLAAALLSMLVDLFRVSAVVGAICFGVLVATIVLLALLRRSEVIPLVLFAGAFVLFGIGAGHGHLLAEGMAVMIAVLLATGVAFLSEYRSDREFEVLNRQKESIEAKILRGGAVHGVPLEDVVVGDIVLLEMGDELPADGRVVEATELLVNQSLMTGESEPVRKAVVRSESDGLHAPATLFRGTQIIDGVGRMVVTEVGDETELGRLARRLAAGPDDDETGSERLRQKLSISKELTPLQEKLADLAGLISRIGYTAAILIFLAQLGRGIVSGAVYWPHTSAQLLDVLRELLDYFITMVIIIVVAVPEGLPMSVTVSLALAMRQMTRANSLVRQLVACETIGSATVICSDKTGTLTQNRMRVERLSFGEGAVDRSSPDWPRLKHPPGWPAATPLETMALVAAVDSTANLEEKEGQIVTLGNTTEGALLRWLGEHDVDYRAIRGQYPVVYQLHFSSDRKRMTTVMAADGRLVCLVKGAPERVLARCGSLQSHSGEIRPLDDAARERITACIDGAARQAMRTLAFAFAVLPADTRADEESLHEHREELESELVYAGFVAIRDPLRDDVRDAIRQCRDAGIRVMMVTGDNPETARAIAHDAGLIERLDEPVDDIGSPILTSTAFNSLGDDELKGMLGGLHVLARATPLDKDRLVRLLQEMREVVAVTGDGTNDAPALKRADVGLAMGIAGTEVSKEASKIVLLDDAFSTIVRAVHWGRALYENIQRFLQFQLTINVSALAITFLGILLFDVRAPFTVLQLLWINVIMDTFASIALCSEPPRSGLMQQKPKRREESILTRPMLTTIFLTAGFFVVVMLGLLLAMRGTPEQPGLFAGSGPWSAEIGPERRALEGGELVKKPDGAWAERRSGTELVVHFTVLQVTLFFTIYVFFQIWNQINCRSLTSVQSGLAGFWRNRIFLAIAGLTALGQVLIVQVGADLFKVEPLRLEVWALVVGATASVLVFAEAVRWLRRSFSEQIA